MAVQLSTVKAQISDEISRGTQLDTKIEARIQQAVRWFERNQNMQYMQRFVDFTLPSSQRAIALPLRPKRFELIRYKSTDGVYVRLPKVSPHEVVDNAGDYPSGWWLDAEQFIRLDTEPKEDLVVEILYYQFSETPVGDTSTHWLFDNGIDFVVYQTMIYMAPLMRELDLVQFYAGLRDEALRTLLNSNDELVQGGQEPKTVYTGGY